MVTAPFEFPVQLVSDDAHYSARSVDHTPAEAAKKLPPACLYRYAGPERWTTIPLSGLSGKTIPRYRHIFVANSLLSRHYPNEVFSRLWTVIADDQYVAFRILTAENIKSRLLHRYSGGLFATYYPFHFLLRRVLPKLNGFRKVARLFRLPVDVSKAEIVGRLIFSGFEPVDLIESSEETIIVARRNPASNPLAPKPSPSEGFLFRMQRIGQNARPINVYKLRSMHPYAEYVQAYLHNTHGLAEGGKFRNDFRISTGGKLLRKYWLDEIPMLYNLLRGDLKLIGVRPISEHYLGLYPESARAIRVRHKPGLLPPFYADLPKTFDEIVQSELAYLRAYEQAPLRTDLHYLKRILKNILIHKARST